MFWPAVHPPMLAVNPYVSGTMLYALYEAGLVSPSLRVCLDFGDDDCYSSGQTVNNLAPDDATDFWRGNDANSDNTDPTFNGVAGNMSANEYFSFANDWFQRKSAHDTALNAMHKDAAKWGAFVVIQHDLQPNPKGIFGDADNTTGVGNPGVAWWFSGGSSPKLTVTAMSETTLMLNKASDASLPGATWMALAVSIDDPANSGFLWRDGGYLQVGSQNTFACQYPAPPTTPANFALQIGSVADGNASLDGHFMAAFMLWSGVAPSKSQLDVLYSRIKSRWSLP